MYMSKYYLVCLKDLKRYGCNKENTLSVNCNFINICIHVSLFVNSLNFYNEAMDFILWKRIQYIYPKNAKAYLDIS